MATLTRVGLIYLQIEEGKWIGERKGERQRANWNWRRWWEREKMKCIHILVGVIGDKERAKDSKCLE